MDDDFLFTPNSQNPWNYVFLEKSIREIVSKVDIDDLKNRQGW